MAAICDGICKCKDCVNYKSDPEEYGRMSCFAKPDEKGFVHAQRKTTAALLARARKPHDYTDKIGTTIWARNKESKGTITNIVNRWCSGCQSMGPVYSVKWDDGRRTYPCPAGCKTNTDGTEEIE